jgi:hypothetical protein
LFLYSCFFFQKLKLQNGYGFVHFRLTPEGIRSAINATNAIHQVTIDRVTYDCSLSHSLEVVMNHDGSQGSELEGQTTGEGSSGKADGVSTNHSQSGDLSSANSNQPQQQQQFLPPPLVPNPLLASTGSNSGSNAANESIPTLMVPPQHQHHGQQHGQQQQQGLFQPHHHLHHPHSHPSSNQHSHHPSPGLENPFMIGGAGGAPQSLEGYDPNLDALTKSFHDSLMMGGHHQHGLHGTPPLPPPGSNPFFPSLYTPHMQYPQMGGQPGAPQMQMTQPMHPQQMHPGQLQQQGGNPYLQANPYPQFSGLFYNNAPPPGTGMDGKPQQGPPGNPYSLPPLHAPISSIFAPSYDLGDNANFLHNPNNSLHPISHLQLFPSSDPFHPSPQPFDPVLFPNFTSPPPAGATPPIMVGNHNAGGHDGGDGQQRHH